MAQNYDTLSLMISSQHRYRKAMWPIFKKGVHFRQIGNLGLNWPKISGNLYLMM